MNDDQQGASETGRSANPRVWVLLGQKTGDNAQVQNLARAVGWPYIEKRIVVLPEWEQGKPLIRPSLDHVDRARSDVLEEPWPDLVFASGRRLACVALWIKQRIKQRIEQTSDQRVRIVMVGMPRHRRREFDLMVVASHYVTRPAPNIAQHDLPLMNVDTDRIAAAVAAWAPRFSELARPITALMIGGPTGGLRFDLEAARGLLAQALQDVAESGGSLWVTTSRRTPADIVAMLERECPATVRLHVFDARAQPSENPYHALLGLADHFIVTTDSLSMMIEVVRLGKSLAMFPLACDVGGGERALQRLGLLRPLDPRHDPIPAGGLRARLLQRLGIPIHSRDLSAIPRRLVERGLAGWLGDPRVTPSEGAGDELERVARKVRELIPRPLSR